MEILERVKKIEGRKLINKTVTSHSRGMIISD